MPKAGAHRSVLSASCMLHTHCRLQDRLLPVPLHDEEPGRLSLLLDEGRLPPRRERGFGSSHDFGTRDNIFLQGLL